MGVCSPLKGCAPKTTLSTSASTLTSGAQFVGPSSGPHPGFEITVALPRDGTVPSLTEPQNKVASSGVPLCVRTQLMLAEPFEARRKEEVAFSADPLGSSDVSHLDAQYIHRGYQPPGAAAAWPALDHVRDLLVLGVSVRSTFIMRAAVPKNENHVTLKWN